MRSEEGVRVGKVRVERFGTGVEARRGQFTLKATDCVGGELRS